MNVIIALNTIEELAKKYRNSIALEQNVAVKQQLEEEALKAINTKSQRYLALLEMEKPLQAATCKGCESANEGRFDEKNITTKLSSKNQSRFGL
ncbi:hypothetical protein QTO01_11345 [Vibrio mytili]|uniref:hypothetical protein n=1 Tax=Vibrio mytili TaxID=50718 RepID=UPI002F420BA5